jgi:hypothetical protein
MDRAPDQLRGCPLAPTHLPPRRGDLHHEPKEARLARAPSRPGAASRAHGSCHSPSGPSGPSPDRPASPPSEPRLRVPGVLPSLFHGPEVDLRTVGHGLSQRHERAVGTGAFSAGVLRENERVPRVAKHPKTRGTFQGWGRRFRSSAGISPWIRNPGQARSPGQTRPHTRVRQRRRHYLQDGKSPQLRFSSVRSSPQALKGSTRSTEPRKR